MSNEQRWKIWRLLPTELTGLLNDLRLGRVAGGGLEGLPEDAFVHHTQWDPQALCFAVVFQSRVFDAVPEGGDIPVAPATLTLKRYSPNAPVPIAGTMTLPGPMTLSGRISRRCFEELRAGCTPRGTPSPIPPEGAEAEPEAPELQKNLQAKKGKQVARKP